MITLPDNSLFAVLALVFSAGLGVILSPLARRIGLVDRPDDELKDHSKDTPMVGGIIVFVALHAGLVLAGRFDMWLFGVTFFLLLVGVLDDIGGLSPLMRLGAAVVGGLLLAYSIGADADLVAGALVVVFIVVAINSVNLLDGADGVAGSAALASALGFVFLALIRDVDAVPALILAGAIGGFLILNWPTARTFLGDGGAYVVAAGLAYLALTSSGSGVDLETEWFPRVLLAMSLFGVFLIDLVVTLLRRILARQPLFGGDRSHVYDQLADMGWSPARVAVAVAVTQVSVVALVLVFDLLLTPWLATGLAIFTVHLAVTLLCAMGFAYRGVARVPPSEIFQDPDPASTV